MVSIGELLDAVAGAINSHADELTALDQAIGDGDHGVNLRRGFDALQGQREELRTLPLGQALNKAGMTLVMKVGGASGPLYGSLFMGMGKAMPEAGTTALGSDVLDAGITLVTKRGKAAVGDKTMLDVLVPVRDALRDAEARSLAMPALLDAADAAAIKGLEATRDMLARKGRASFLGERSVGHLDPGARSSQLLVSTLCDVWRGKL